MPAPYAEKMAIWLQSEQDPCSLLKSKYGLPTALIQEILSWTNENEFLALQICEKIKKSRQLIINGDEKSCVRDIVNSLFIEQYGNPEITRFFTELEELLIPRKELLPKKIEMLCCYRSLILQRELDKKKVLDILEHFNKNHLIVHKEGNWIVANRIYREIFNGQWIFQKMANIFYNISNLTSEEDLLEAIEKIKANGIDSKQIKDIKRMQDEIPIQDKRSSKNSIKVFLPFILGLLLFSILSIFSIRSKSDELHFNKAIGKATEGQMFIAIDILCKLSEESKFYDKASFQLETWLKDEYWKNQRLDQYIVEQQSSCPVYKKTGTFKEQ